MTEIVPAEPVAFTREPEILEVVSPQSPAVVFWWRHVRLFRSMARTSACKRGRDRSSPPSEAPAFSSSIRSAFPSSSDRSSSPSAASKSSLADQSAFSSSSSSAASRSSDSSLPSPVSSSSSSSVTARARALDLPFLLGLGVPAAFRARTDQFPSELVSPSSCASSSWAAAVVSSNAGVLPSSCLQ